MLFCGISLSRSLLGAKRTWLVAAHMSAFDPKRTFTMRHVSSTLLRLLLLQRYGHTTQTEGGFKADLFSLQLQNYAVRVP
jgi:hypothetical protein